MEEQPLLYDAVCGFVSQNTCLKASFCFVQPLSLALLDSSPSRGAFGKTKRFLLYREVLYACHKPALR